MQKVYKINNVGLSRMIEAMFKNIKSGDTLYISFSKKSFRILVFTMSMGVIANIILVYIIIKLFASYPILRGQDVFTYAIILILSIVAVLSGLWLVFKGIDIVTDNEDFN